MNVIVHYPRTVDKQAELERTVAKFRAEYILRHVERLNCPLEQKIALIDAVIDTIRSGEAV